MPSEVNASPKLIGFLRMARIAYLIALVPLALFGLFGLFLFFVATERRILDWIYFAHHALVLVFMLVAVMKTGRLIHDGSLKTALLIYAVPVFLIAGLILYESMN